MLGIFAYYSKWILGFSHKIQPLIDVSFPLSDETMKEINNLKGSMIEICKIEYR